MFDEIRFLLESGQPEKYAHIPTLEIHIAILRNFILAEGIPVLEIPPTPAGFDFVCCLTHDVDFLGIRNHRFDHTMFGFLYRAVIGSLINLVKKKISWKQMLENFRAVLLLPAVYLGIIQDFWITFDKYMQIEKDLRSTFFFLPYKNYSGNRLNGKRAARRASKYDIIDAKQHVEYLMARGCEIGLHGIDAWNGVEKGLKEFDRISSLTGRSDLGVRMHWLYFNSESPMVLEKAGFLYDSTYGYNNSVGFRAGTSQVFRPLSTERLLELPLQIQDTALFYSNRMGLDEDSALELCRMLFRINSMYGGGVVINWHHRSIAPERLWGEFYEKLLHHLREYRVWFGTAGEVVCWFDKRRKVQFEEVKLKNGGLKVKICGQEGFSGPDLILRLYKPRLPSYGDSEETVNSFNDVLVRDSDTTEISF